MIVSHLVKFSHNIFDCVVIWHNKHVWTYERDYDEKYNKELMTDFGTYAVKSWEYFEDENTLSIEI